VQLLTRYRNRFLALPILLFSHNLLQVSIRIDGIHSEGSLVDEVHNPTVVGSLLMVIWQQWGPMASAASHRVQHINRGLRQPGASAPRFMWNSHLHPERNLLGPCLPLQPLLHFCSSHWHLLPCPLLPQEAHALLSARNALIYPSDLD
jgi:hypothetical protein